MPTTLENTGAHPILAKTNEPLLPSSWRREGDIATVLGALAHWFSATEYELLAETGVLHEDSHLELIEGRIIDMAPIGSSHASCVKRTLATFVTMFQHRAIVSVQDPVQLDAYSEPQPDLMLLQPRDDFYAQHHPTPDDVLLLLEIADTLLEYDRDIKIPLYARHAIQEVWLLNLRDRNMVVYRSPAPDGYEEMGREWSLGDQAHEKDLYGARGHFEEQDFRITSQSFHSPRQAGGGGGD